MIYETEKDLRTMLLAFMVCGLGVAFSDSGAAVVCMTIAAGCCVFLMLKIEAERRTAEFIERCRQEAANDAELG